MMSKWNYDNEHLKKRVLELEIGLSIVFRRVFFLQTTFGLIFGSDSHSNSGGTLRRVFFLDSHIVHLYI